MIIDIHREEGWPFEPLSHLFLELLGHCLSHPAPG